MSASGGGGKGSRAERLRAARREAESLKQRLTELKTEKNRMDLGGQAHDPSASFSLGIVRRLVGHFGKVYSMHWAADSQRLVSASQDGKLIVWNGSTENKLHAIGLKTAWVMTCAFDQSEQGKHVASGGLDNVCSLFDLTNPVQTVSAAVQELTGHDGYLSCCRFRGDQQVLTSSGDATCALWNVERGAREREFRDHVGDVMGISLNPRDENMFVSGSVDATARLWDIRDKQCVCSFLGHESDINAVDFMSNGNTFATGSDDFTCRMYDMRCMSQVCVYQGSADDDIDVKGTGNRLHIDGGVTSVAFSRSGKLLFAGYEDNRCIAWETTSPESKFHILQHHKEEGENNRISCVGVAPDGRAICTGSWDTMLAVWA